MATATSIFASYDRSIPSVPVSPPSSKLHYDFFNPNPSAPRLGRCLDDMVLLGLRPQYTNMDLLDQSTLSNSAEDFSQFDRFPYNQVDIFDQDPDDIDDYDLPYGTDEGYDYIAAIQDRLKKANEEFEHDQTSTKLKQPQRVSFDTVVKAVDIVQDATDSDLLVKSSVPTVPEEPSNPPPKDTGSNEYTVPLNDTQPREGPTLLEQIKALQFHSAIPSEERWATTVTDTKEDNAEIAASKKSMIVSVNGRFDIQNEDDYTSQQQVKSDQAEKTLFLPKPPTEPKQKQTSSRRPLAVRPKSSDSGRRGDVKTTADKKPQSATTTRQRPTSAGVLKPLETLTEKSSGSVDFEELLRKGAEKKRAEMREDRRQKEEAEERRQKELAKAKESYERWTEEKTAGRKRINEEKRLEREEQEARQTVQERELAELREKKYKDWLQRKHHDILLSNEFKRLQADEELMASAGGGTSSSNTNHRAFQKWLRRKYEQSLEEKRQLRLEEKLRRRRQHPRSSKRHHLQQDLQLAKSFGYS